MSPPRLRFYLGAFSLLSLTAIHVLINLILSPERSGIKAVIDSAVFMEILLCAILVFVWISLGRIIGFTATLLSLSLTYLSFLDSDITSLRYHFYYMLSLLAGYKTTDIFFRSDRKYMVKFEKIEKDTNLIRDELEKNNKETRLLQKRLERLNRLSSLVQDFSSALSKEEVIKAIVKKSYEILGRSDRMLFFLVDTARQKLELVCSKKAQDASFIKSKSGDIFDGWVLKKRQPLLIKNINNDFRFSLEEQDVGKGFASIISAPLISEDKVLGILRLDSPIESFYFQEDLRLLDIISGLAIVAVENALLYEQLNALAITDSLTSLYVHKYFKERLASEVKRSLKNDTTFSLLFLDIDNFKSYNDKYGHTAGDLALKHIARLLKKHIQPGDIASRYGGEEFASILLDKNRDSAFKFAEDLRKEIESSPLILRREKTGITVSIGTAVFPYDSTLVEDLIRDADRRLYEAKSKGKNMVCSS